MTIAQKMLTKSVTRYIELTLTATATIGGVIAVYVGLVSYRQRTLQDAAIAERELTSRIWEQRVSAYSETSRVASVLSELAHAPNHPEWASDYQLFKTTSRDFRQLERGRMALLEDTSVFVAMYLYREALNDIEFGTHGKKISPDDLQTLSLALTHAFRKSLRRTWNPHGSFDPLGGVDKPLTKMVDVLTTAGLTELSFNRDHLSAFE